MSRGQESSDMRSLRINCSLLSEFKLVQENILLQNERITQLYVIQSKQNPFLWFGVVFIDTGIYCGAVVRFNMYIEESYPDCPCPKIVFSPIPYHPLINPMTGELDTKNAFPDWNSNSRKLFELLLFVKRVMRMADNYIEQVKEMLIRQAQRKDGNLLLTLPADQAIKATDSKENTLHGSDNDASRSQNEKVIEIETDTSRAFDSSVDKTQEQPAHTKFVLDENPKRFFTWPHHTINFIEVYENDRLEFTRRIEEFKGKCYEHLLDKPALCGDDENALIFTPWDMDVHEPIRTCILSGRFTQSSLFAAYHKETDSVSFIPGHSNNY